MVFLRQQSITSDIDYTWKRRRDPDTYTLSFSRSPSSHVLHTFSYEKLCYRFSQFSVLDFFFSFFFCFFFHGTHFPVWRIFLFSKGKVISYDKYFLIPLDVDAWQIPISVLGYAKEFSFRIKAWMGRWMLCIRISAFIWNSQNPLQWILWRCYAITNHLILIEVTQTHRINCLT